MVPRFAYLGVICLSSSLVFLIFYAKYPDRFVLSTARSSQSQQYRQHKICIAASPPSWNEQVIQLLSKPNNDPQAKFKPEFLLEKGYGKKIPDTNLFDTNQFLSDVMFYHKMKSVYADVNCNQADLVYVPLLFASLVRINKEFASSVFLQNVSLNLPYIDSKPHLVILGRVESDFRCSWGGSVLCEPTHPNLWFVVAKQGTGYLKRIHGPTFNQTQSTFHIRVEYILKHLQNLGLKQTTLGLLSFTKPFNQNQNSVAISQVTAWPLKSTLRLLVNTLKPTLSILIKSGPLNHR